ncbi:sensor histidine kinase [Pedobacter xixiisoli]|uniref:Histidine kinase n=1 Tax=Pedobacter xixiisoli TaxID=1476464 RepID=A0A286AE50_9SPHI|nr:sensor histidine kinase [Pedobacter xixiisoli]SOD20180.1 Histidine kinase [Pedobacter xixiisoli]
MKNNSKASLILNCIFWGVIAAFLIIALVLFNSKHTLREYIVTWLGFGLINIAIFYINYLVLIPELIKKKKLYWWYVVCFILLLLASCTIKTFIAALNPEETLRYTEEGKVKYMELTWFFVNRVFIGGFFLVSSCIIKFAVDWFSNERVQRSLESEKKDMELQFLKSQLNPHFLFNSLNNIYSLAYQKSDKTADAILKLSEIMRYMIYESNDSWVSLDKEVEYVESYVELQKLRFKDGAAVEISINGVIDGQKIVPLILISFVENAFKHGVANDAEDPIKINIIANQKILHFSVTNKKNTTNKDAIGGVGLNNVERRLQLLYPDRYKLNIVNSATHYTTELMLDL